MLPTSTYRRFFDNLVNLPWDNAMKGHFTLVTLMHCPFLLMGLQRKLKQVLQFSLHIFSNSVHRRVQRGLHNNIRHFCMQYNSNCHFQSLFPLHSWWLHITTNQRKHHVTLASAPNSRLATLSNLQRLTMPQTNQIWQSAI